MMVIFIDLPAYHPVKAMFQGLSSLSGVTIRSFYYDYETRK